MLPGPVLAQVHDHGSAAATSAPVWQSLFTLYFGIAAAVAVLVLGYLVFALWRYRAEPGALEPADAPAQGKESPERGHAGWVVAAAGGIAAVLFALSFGTLGASDFIEHAPPGDAVHVDVTAFRFGWRFHYAEGFDSLGELRVPVGKPVLLNVTSQDVFHNFALPDYKVRIDAMPGRVNHLWFQATQPGAAQAVCVELCGLGHAYMRATVLAVAPADYEAWVHEQLEPVHLAPGLTFNITLDDAGPHPATLTAPTGAEVRLHVTNLAHQALGLRVDASEAVLGALAPQASGWLKLTPDRAADLTYQPTDATAAPVGPPGVLHAVAPQELQVTLEEFTVRLDGALRAGVPVKVNVTNAGGVPHDFTLGVWAPSPTQRQVFVQTPTVEPGESQVVYWTPDAAGPRDAWCSVPGHAQAGMRATLEVGP